MAIFRYQRKSTSKLFDEVQNSLLDGVPGAPPIQAGGVSVHETVSNSNNDKMTIATNNTSHDKNKVAGTSCRNVVSKDIRIRELFNSNKLENRKFSTKRLFVTRRLHRNRYMYVRFGKTNSFSEGERGNSLF